MYSYDTEKETLFTDAGSRLFIHDRDAVLRLLRQSGALRMTEATRVMQPGDSFRYLATMDRMVELGDLRELTGNVRGQDRVFVLVEKF